MHRPARPLPLLVRPRGLLLALCALAGVHARAPAQSPTEGLTGRAAPRAEDAPLLAIDGEPVAPGRIPAGTPPEAMRMWNAFRASLRVPGDAPPPLHGFRLGFDMRTREEGQSNDVAARFQYWDEKGWLSAQIDKSGRTLLSGPEGPFLIDQGNASSLRGRDYKDDRRKLEEWTAIARNYLRLAEPERVRLVELSARAPDEFLWTARELRPIATGLEWLSVRSPDFRLAATGESGREAIYQARLGLAKTSGELVIAILHEERDGLPVPDSLQVIHVRAHEVLAGRRVPSDLAVWRSSLTLAPGVMAPKPYAELSLLPGGDLQPAFREEEFRPPQRR